MVEIWYKKVDKRHAIFLISLFAFLSLCRQQSVESKLANNKTCGQSQKIRDTRKCVSYFLEQHFCCAKVLACGRMPERERGNPQRFPPHTPPSLRCAGVQTANPGTITKRKATHSGGFTFSRPLAKMRTAHYNSVAVCDRPAGTAMFPAKTCEVISEWNKEDKTHDKSL